MHGEVLGAGVGFQHGRLGIALQAAHDRHAQLAGEIRVFAVGFHPAAPARVAEDVDVGRPKRKSLILPHRSRFAGLAVLDPGLVGNGREHGFDLFRIERGGHADGLREHRGAAVAGYAVQRFVPPVVGGDAEPRDGLGFILDQGRLLLERQLREQVGRPHFGWQGLVEIRYFLGGVAGRQQRQR